MKRIFTLLTCTLSLGLNAQTPLMENFNYGTTDSLVAVTYNNGWLLVNSTVNPLRANGTGLTYTGYANSGTGNAVPMTNNGQDACKDFRNAASYTSGSVYASFLANISAAQATGDYIFGLLPAGSVTAFYARTFVKLSSTGYFRVGISKSSVGANEALVYSNDSFALNTTYLFVAKYTFNSASTTDDSVRLYVFSSGVPSTEPATARCSALGGTNTDAANISRVFLRQGSATNAPTLVIDEIRVSNTWANGPLPVEMLHFTGKVAGNNVLLTWSTANESNCKGFEIERSTNGDQFERVGFVAGAGNSTKTSLYKFEDEIMDAPQVYYRLKQLDLDGNAQYSETINLNFNHSEVEIGPNPFAETLTISGQNSATVLQAEVMDIQGKIKLSSTGTGNLELDTHNLKSGVYFIRVNSGGISSIRKLIKN